MSESGISPERDLVASALGAEEAAALRVRLADAGLTVVAAEELAELERQAGAYRRMRQLVEEP